MVVFLGDRADGALGLWALVTQREEAQLAMEAPGSVTVPASALLSGRGRGVGHGYTCLPSTASAALGAGLRENGLSAPHHMPHFLLCVGLAQEPVIQTLQATWGASRRHMHPVLGRVNRQGWGGKATLASSFPSPPLDQARAGQGVVWIQPRSVPSH